MKIYYRIIQFSPEDHCVMIRYFTDLFSEDYLANFFDEDGSIKRTKEGYPVRCRTDFNILISESEVPSEEDILKLVNTMAPRHMFKTMEGVYYKRYNLKNVESMVGLTGEVKD